MKPAACRPEDCEPCGACRWCQRDKRARAHVTRLRRLLREALHEISSELRAAGDAAEIAQNPLLKAKDRLCDRLAAELERGTP